MTAQLLKDTAPAQQERPVPTRIIADFFPASVRLPGVDGLAHNARVQLTDVGLYVFAKRPPLADLSDALYFSPIVWSETTNQRPPARVSFTIMTEAGQVGVTQMLGCGCALADLKYWVPAWTSRSLPWGGGDGA
jgi:hypothetical protein